VRLLCLGCNHQTADVALRERLAFDADQADRALADLRARWPGGEYAVLSTCNRSEVYVARAVHGHPRRDELVDWLGAFHRLGRLAYRRKLYTHADEQAIRHLFAVAAGLESMVPGEGQIVAQVKEAYRIARRAGTAGKVLNELFPSALHVAKHVRSELPKARAGASVASVAVELIRRRAEDLRDKCVLLAGAGDNGLLILQRLSKLRPGRVVLANRTLARAQSLAQRYGGEAIKLSALPDRLAWADVVITSTAARQPIVAAEAVRAAQRKRHWRRLLLIDLSVPRNIDPEAGTLRNVTLKNIDDLRDVLEKARKQQEREDHKARALIDRHVSALLTKLSIRRVAPTIEALYRRMQEIADQELAVARNKLATHDDAEADEAILRRALHRTLRRALHPCTRNLRNRAASRTVRADIAALRRLFDLDKPS